jgi:hypothetical protein
MNIRGTFVHPKLVNYIAIWASPEYAVIVGEIMDAVNERYNLKAITFEAEIAVMKVQHDIEIAGLNATIVARNATIVAQSDFIQKTAVPEHNSEKKLWVIQNNNESYRIRADSHAKFFNGWIYQFTFPASMNVKQEVQKQFHGTKGFNLATIRNVLSYLKTLNPKLTIEV